MPDAEALAKRLRAALEGHRRVTERRMFGGVCFMLRGHMLCGSAGPGLMFRVGRKQEAEALSRRGARPMDFTGRPMTGFVWVDPGACDGRALRRWIALAESYVSTLPPKET